MLADHDESSVKSIEAFGNRELADRWGMSFNRPLGHVARCDQISSAPKFRPRFRYGRHLTHLRLCCCSGTWGRYLITFEVINKLPRLIRPASSLRVRCSQLSAVWIIFAHLVLLVLHGVDLYFTLYCLQQCSFEISYASYLKNTPWELS